MALIDKASLLMVPSTYEDGTLYNVLPSGNKAPDETGNHNGYDQTRADFTFDRGSNLAATRIDENGVLQKGRENLLLQSNNFDTTWTLVNNATLTSGQSGYDGSSNAWKLNIQNTFSGFLRQNISTSNLNSFSVYAKADTLSWIRISINGAQNASAYFDIANGALGSSIASVDTSINSVGNDWYRVTLVTNDSAITAVRIYGADADGVLGVGGSIYIQSAQLEKGLVSTPYIETGATTAKAGILEDMPRIDYTSGTGALLLEPLRTNIVTSSEYVSSNDYVVANWTGTITTNTTETTSPEGVYNATKYVKSGASDRVYFHSSQPDGAYTGSVWLKAASGSENTTIEISVRRFGGGGGSTSKLVTITNEWQRFDVTATNLTGGTTTAMYVADFSMGGTATEFYSYGMQIEAGNYASSYIPSYGSAVSRSADSCSVTGVSDVIGQTEGTLFVECEYERTSTAVTARKLISVNSGNSTNLVDIFCPSLGNNLTARVRANGGQFGAISISNAPTGMIKIAYAYKANDYALYINGTQYGTDTTGGAFTFSSSVSTHQIGDGEAGGDELGGVIKESILFKERLSNSELADLTA